MWKRTVCAPDRVAQGGRDPDHPDFSNKAATDYIRGRRVKGKKAMHVVGEEQQKRP